MNRLGIAVLAICVCLLPRTQLAAKGKKAAGGGEDQIKALLEQSRQAVLKGDSAYAETVADDYIRTNPDGKTLTKTDFVNGMKSGDWKYESVEPGDRKIQVYGDAAVVTSGATLKGTYKGQDVSGSYRTTRVFIRRAGKWQEVAFQATRVSP